MFLSAILKQISSLQCHFEDLLCEFVRESYCNNPYFFLTNNETEMKLDLITAINVIGVNGMMYEHCIVLCWIPQRIRIASEILQVWKSMGQFTYFIRVYYSIRISQPELDCTVNCYLVQLSNRELVTHNGNNFKIFDGLCGLILLLRINKHEFLHVHFRQWGIISCKQYKPWIYNIRIPPIQKKDGKSKTGKVYIMIPKRTKSVCM